MENNNIEREESLEERLEKELYGQVKSERLGKVKKIWGRKTKEIKPSEEWQENLFDSNVFDFFNFNLKKVFIISFFLFLISLGIFSFVFYYRAINLRGVEINISGPVDVNSFQSYEYNINIYNNTNLDIDDVQLSIKLDNGVYFFDNIEQNELFYKLDKIISKNSKDLKIKLFFVSNLGKNLNFEVEAIYKSPRKNQRFNLSKKFTVTVKKEPISFQIFSPNQIFLNEPFIISLKFTNISEIPYDLSLSLDSDPKLEILSITPPPVVGFNWEFTQIQPNKSDEINITAKFTNFVNKPTIFIQPKIIYQNKEFILKDYNLTLKVLETPIKLEITSNPQDYIVDLDKYINYEIKWENRSKVSLKNVQVKVYLEGNFDFQSIKTDGYYSPIENSIIWNSINKPQLLAINPGNSDYVNFSIKTINKYLSGSKNLYLKVKVVLETETIPPEIQILTNKLSVETQESKIIAGNLALNIKVLYDNQFNNTGPFPLVNGEKTTLSAYLEICTLAEDFQNIIISGKLPLGVKPTGNFGLNFDVNNFQFNPDTGEFQYKIDELSYGYCDIYPDYKIAFQIEVLPPLYGDIRNFVVIPSIKITGQGKFSQKTFELTTRAIDILKINNRRF
ncbi:MAG: hypothetical protein KatS3mg095_0349 [Candidatus Parcubacteria bacterium]|nr:MAG: hypothetical protein KatS3mg095_0349 [Candidatus Parcubacteria bacterium]